MEARVLLPVPKRIAAVVAEPDARGIARGFVGVEPGRVPLFAPVDRHALAGRALTAGRGNVGCLEDEDFAEIETVHSNGVATWRLDMRPRQPHSPGSSGSTWSIGRW